jgi:hypothetical protein
MEKRHRPLARKKLLIEMKRILVGILVGIAFTILFFLVAMFSDGACHCVKPTIIFFPYSSIALEKLAWDSISLPLMILQFPIYSMLLAGIKNRTKKALILLTLLTCHLVAATIGLTLHRG